jgi:hypothetical protein
MARAEPSDKMKNNAASMVDMKPIRPSVNDKNLRSSADLLGDIYKLMVKARKSQVTDMELERNHKKEEEYKDQKRHKEILKALTVRRKPKAKKKKEVKKDENKSTSNSSVVGDLVTSKAVTEAEKTVAKAAVKETAKTAEKAAVKETVKQAEGTAVKETAKTAEKAAVKETVKPTNIPKKMEVFPSATKIGKVTPNIAKIGSLSLSTAAIATIAGETGAGKEKPEVTEKQILNKAGQINRNDPEKGFHSYGVFGINSGTPKKGKRNIVNKGTSLDNFIKDNPQFGMSSSMTLDQIDELWEKNANKDPKRFLEAQNKWYEKYVLSEVAKDMQKFKGDQTVINDPRVFDFLADRRNQQGSYGLTQSFEYAKDSKSPEELITKMASFDIANLENVFSTAIKKADKPENFKKGLADRSRLRAERALGKKLNLEIPKLEMNNQDDKSKLDSISKENKDLKDQSNKNKPSGSGNVTNQTTVVNQTTEQRPQRPDVDDRPAHQRIK